MNFLQGITVLLLYQLAGEVTVLLLKVPVPGPVVGMVLLFVTLVVRRQVHESMHAASATLLGHLSLLFVPAGVGVIVHLDMIRDEWLSIGVALVLSTAITLAATALIMLGASRWLTRGVKTDG